ncbi:hypothetical protein FRC05_001583 [Tulasnella sp. 425]|nr:hypothetical protein FRC05_001583 [Tulasnella sp. 425]
MEQAIGADDSTAKIAAYDHHLGYDHRPTTIGTLQVLVDQVIERKAKPKKEDSNKKESNTKRNGAEANRQRKARQSTRVEKRKAEGGKEAYAKETAESVAETQRNASQAAKETRTKQVSEEHHWQQLATKLKTEPAFKALYIAGSRIFASLEADLNTGREITKTKSKEEKMHLKWTLTMAAKWAPTLQCNHDRRTNISTGIALVM